MGAGRRWGSGGDGRERAVAAAAAAGEEGRSGEGEPVAAGGDGEPGRRAAAAAAAGEEGRSGSQEGGPRQRWRPGRREKAGGGGQGETADGCCRRCLT
jgi:hypothetical protein